VEDDLGIDVGDTVAGREVVGDAEVLGGVAAGHVMPQEDGPVHQAHRKGAPADDEHPAGPEPPTIRGDSCEQGHRYDKCYRESGRGQRGPPVSGVPSRRRPP
jgi:hypothetical protein